MSARKLTTAEPFPAILAEATSTTLTLPASAVRIRKNGIEFRTKSPIQPWTEMTVHLQAPLETGKVHCTGVVVACDGNRHAGYLVSLLFTHLSKQSQARLDSIAFSLPGNPG